MTATNSQRILQHIRRLVGEHDRVVSDGELLRRYGTGRDQSAFAELVRRHGAMVFAVCRSVLRRHDDAEDAFQATLLILARRAGTIRKPDALSSWLHGVAHRVALKARAERARRQTRESRATPPTVSASACDDLSWGELRAVLHAELAALPERFRTPLVLCYLEGLTQDEAAIRLGCTAATVKGRLQRGREKLRRRLERRGVTLTATLAAALTGQSLSAAVQGVPSFTEETATATAKTLAGAVLRPLMPLKLAMLSAVVLTASLVAAGLGLRGPTPEGVELASGGKTDSERSAPREVFDAHGDPLPEGAAARLGTVRFNHGEGLQVLSFSPDDKTIVSAGKGGIRLWEAGSGKELDRIRTDKISFNDQIVLLADGKTLVSLKEGSDADIATFWDLARKKESGTKKLPVRREVFSAYHNNCLSPDGKLCVCNSHTPAQMKVFDLTTGKELYKLTGGHQEGCVAVFAGNDRLITIDKKRGIAVHEARTGKRIRELGPTPSVDVLAASSDGRWLAVVERQMLPFRLPNGEALSLHDRDVIHVWDVSRGARKHALAARPKRWHFHVQFSPDGEFLFASSTGHKEPYAVMVWDVETGQPARELGGACGRVLSVSPDKTRLVEGDQGKFNLWDLKTGQCLSSPDSPHALTETIFLSPTADRVFTFGRASISVWDGTTGRRLRTFDLPSYPYRDPFRSHSFSPDGRYASSFDEREGHLEVLLWDIASGRRLHTLRPPGTLPYVRHDVQNATRVFAPLDVTTAFAPDSSLFATWHPDPGPLVRIWDMSTGEQVRSFRENKAGWSGQMFFSADGKTLVVAGPNVAGYEVSSGKELFSWRMEPSHSRTRAFIRRKGLLPLVPWSAMAISPRDMVIAADHDDEEYRRWIVLYDARTGKALRRWNDPNQSHRWFEQLVFSADGALLASSAGDVIHLWEVATGQEVRTFRGHRDVVTYVAFSADCRRLASGSLDSTVLLWDLTGSSIGEDVEQAWAALAGRDARRAYEAVWTLARNPERTLPLLRDRLRPVKPVGREHIDRWIKDLDSGQFDIREKATAELGKCGELAEPALRRALAQQPTLEQRHRIELLLSKLDAAIPDGEALRSLRAVRALEHTGTSEARQLLRELASGAEDARLTRQAKAALGKSR
jgi:RNA polymerase sigma factor (sigma-70 family)